MIVLRALLAVFAITLTIAACSEEPPDQDDTSDVESDPVAQSSTDDSDEDATEGGTGRNAISSDILQTVSDILSAFAEENWEELRHFSVYPVSDMSDRALAYVYEDLRVPDRGDAVSIDDIDDWDVHTYDDWALAYHMDLPFLRMVLIQDQDEWLHDPGPFALANAKVIEAADNPLDDTDALEWGIGTPEIQVHDIDDSELGSRLSTVIVSDRASIAFEEDTPEIGVPLRLVESAKASMYVDDITWHVGDESGPVSMFWTDAVLDEGGERIVIPGNQDGEVDAHFGFRLEGAPVDGETVRIQFETIRVTGVDLDSLQSAEEIGEVELTVSYEWELELAPDLDAIESSLDQ